LNFKDHFSSLAANYASFRPHYPALLFDYLAKASRRHELAWDCACGSGQATLDLARHYVNVIATDASAAQVAAAAPHPNVQYRVASAEASGIDSGCVDLVTVAQALHWFDLASFYAEVERVLRRGGALAVWTYGVVHAEGESIDRRLQEFYWNTLQPYWPAERRHVESGYRTLPFPFTELTPSSFDMQEYWSLRELLGYIRSWSATARYVEQHGVDPAVILEQGLEQEWGNPQSARKIVWPLSLRIGMKP
jgi:SAM-dependent methyltransferase